MTMPVTHWQLEARPVTLALIIIAFKFCQYY